MQKVPPRKQKQLQPGVPRLKMADYSGDTSTHGSNNISNISNRVNLENMQNRSVTTSSQFQANLQTSLTTTQTKSVSSSTQQASRVKSHLDELKNNISEMKSINLLRKSLENLVDDDADPTPIVTYPDDTPVPSEMGSPTNTMDTIKFEQKTMNNIRTTKVVKDGFSAEKACANFAESKSVQSGDVSYEENSQAAASHAKLEMDGMSAEKSLVKAQSGAEGLRAMVVWAAARLVFNKSPGAWLRVQQLPHTKITLGKVKEARSLITSESKQQELKNMAHTSRKLKTDTFSRESTATEAQQERTVTGRYNAKHTSSSQSNITFTSSTKGIHTSTSTMLQTNAQQFQIMNGKEDEMITMSLDDLDQLNHASTPQEIEQVINKYAACLDKFVECLKQKETGSAKASEILKKIHEIMNKAWAVRTHGHELGSSFCNALRTCGGLDLLMENCTKTDEKLQFATARLLEQCLTTENRSHVVTHGLDKVVNVACVCTNITNSVEHSRVGTGILEHLFKHSEETCSDVIRLGGLDALLFECRKSDVETLRHCAGALANLSLYGGAENQEAMIKRKVPMWLFPLAFHTDDNIKYYACLAITVLVANAEIEAEVLQSGTLGLVEPFVTSHNPSEFAKSNLAHAHGQSKTWLQHLVPVLSSKREEARNLAAFHFCMEAGIKKQQSNTYIFGEIGAIESLKKVASCPNAVASKYAAQALRLIGEEVPHKLSQQVPLWSAEDVEEWVKQIGFTEYAASFIDSRVDGDLLLQLTEDNMRQDIGLSNGIKRQRFFRELQKLKRMADYSSRDSANINNFLQSMGPEFSIYTYSMLNAGVETKESLRSLSEDQLLNECGIVNSIHRLRILEGIRQLENGLSNLKDDNLDKSLDVFVSYRRSNGSQLASLLKVHLQLRGFSVFIDVERLEAGKFDNNLLQSIQKAKHFLLVLTPGALERCLGDVEKKDWVHREIVAALSAQCNIIPIVDNFAFPDAEDLPEDMRQVCHFNAIKWIHDYQDACVDKLERFMRGEMNTRNDGLLNRVVPPGTPSNPAITRQPPCYQRMHSNDSGSGKGSDKDVNGNSGLRD